MCEDQSCSDWFLTYNSFHEFCLQIAECKFLAYGYALLHGQFCMNSHWEWTVELFPSAVHSVLFIPHIESVATSAAEDWVCFLTDWLTEAFKMQSEMNNIW